MKIPLSKIKPSPDNASGRSEMNDAMEELIATIKAVGVCEGISVRPKGSGYEVIGGERRLFAAKKAGLKEVDVVVHDATAEQARLMRLASLAHENWSDDALASAIWRELKDRPKMSHKGLSQMTGLPQAKVTYYAAYHAAKLYDAVVEFDGEVKVAATSEIWMRFNPEKDNRYQSLVKEITNKCSTEKIGYNMEVRKLCNRIKDTLPKIVVFGESKDDDYEEHNFELGAVLEEPFRTGQEYERVISAIVTTKEKNARDEWEVARFDDKVVKKFTEQISAWRKALTTIEKVPAKRRRFSFDSAQFIVNAIEGLQAQENELLGFLREVKEEKKHG